MGVVYKTTDAHLRRNSFSSKELELDWRDLNWRRAFKTVGRLQRRIVKASKAGEKRKVRALQRILIRSTSARVIAGSTSD
jgi:RNA-directed DNA polymerase